MIISKIIGASIITLSALYAYSITIKYQRKRMKQINAFIDLIDYIKNQVECYLLPFDQIILTCNKDLLIRCGIQEHPLKCKTLSDLLLSVNFYCDDEIINLMKQFADNFGQAYLQEQIRSCEYYKNELIKKRDKNQEKDSKNQKIQLALFLCASFSIIILLI